MWVARGVLNDGCETSLDITYSLLKVRVLTAPTPVVSLSSFFTQNTRKNGLVFFPLSPAVSIPTCCVLNRTESVQLSVHILLLLSFFKTVPTRLLNPWDNEGHFFKFSAVWQMLSWCPGISKTEQMTWTSSPNSRGFFLWRKFLYCSGPWLCPTTQQHDVITAPKAGFITHSGALRGHTRLISSRAESRCLSVLTSLGEEEEASPDRESVAFQSCVLLLLLLHPSHVSRTVFMTVPAQDTPRWRLNRKAVKRLQQYLLFLPAINF